MKGKVQLSVASNSQGHPTRRPLSHEWTWQATSTRWSFCRIIPFHSLFHSPTISLGEDYSRPQITHRASYKVKIPLGRLLLNGKMICWKPRLKNWQKLARKEMNTRPH